jgi:hypothetical protein
METTWIRMKAAGRMRKHVGMPIALFLLESLSKHVVFLLSNWNGYAFFPIIVIASELSAEIPNSCFHNNHSNTCNTRTGFFLLSRHHHT